MAWLLHEKEMGWSSRKDIAVTLLPWPWVTTPSLGQAQSLAPHPTLPAPKFSLVGVWSKGWLL